MHVSLSLYKTRAAGLLAGERPGERRHREPLAPAAAGRG